MRATDHWQPSYDPAEYDLGRQLRKLRDVAEFLMRSSAVDPDTIDRHLAESIAHMRRSFDVYEGRIDPGFAGSFCFVVPTRVARGSNEYSDEVVGTLPLLRHVGHTTRQLVLAGICPSVIETYRPDPTGRQGAMVLAPIFKDIASDISNPAWALALTYRVIADTAWFIRNRLGAEVMGLGATLPLLTFLARKHLGLSVEEPGLTLTTGHGGTVWLLNETIEQARDQLSLRGTDRVGFIGAGGIGRSAAAYLLSGDPAAEVTLYDSDTAKLHRVTAELAAQYGTGRVTAARDSCDILSRGGVIVSAVTSPISLTGPEYEGLALDGTFVLDDSQPHAVSRESVEARGGHVGWVIGEDRSERGVLTFTRDFDYGGWGPVRCNEVWGCEAEAGSIYLQSARDAAITKAVTPDAARRIGELCQASSIGPAPLQSFGKYLALPALTRSAAAPRERRPWRLAPALASA
jgi:predicted amino acid dehydrogenase